MDFPAVQILLLDQEDQSLEWCALLDIQTTLSVCSSIPTSMSGPRHVCPEKVLVGHLRSMWRGCSWICEADEEPISPAPTMDPALKLLTAMSIPEPELATRAVPLPGPSQSQEYITTWFCGLWVQVPPLYPLSNSVLFNWSRPAEFITRSHHESFLPVGPILSAGSV